MQWIAIDWNENGNLQCGFPTGTSRLTNLLKTINLLFFLQHRNTSVDPAEIIALLVQMLESFLTVFGVCELGEKISISFQEINIVLDELKWYLLPHKIRKFLPTILIVAQEPIGLNIFGTILCSRKTFQEVSWSSSWNLIWLNIWWIFDYVLGLQQNLFIVYDTSTCQ